MEAQIPPENGGINMGKRWAVDPSTPLSLELPHIHHKNHYCGFDWLASAQSQMCNTAGVRCIFFKCPSVCHGKRLSSTRMWRSNIQWTRWMYAYLHGCVA